MAPSLEIRHLRLLATASETQSLTEAAELLGVTQSALSHRLREAERRLGTQLFAREREAARKGLRLTPAGERLLITARRLLSDLSRAESDIRQMTAQGIRHVLRIGQGVYSGYHWLPRFLDAKSVELADIQVEIRADSSRRPLELLTEGEVDLALVLGGVVGRGFNALPLFTDELVAVMPTGHRLARRPHIEAGDIAEEDFLAYGFVIEPGFEHERFMQPAGIFPKRVIKIGQPEAIIELIRAGKGISILSRWAVWPHRRAGLVASVKVGPGGLPIDWYAVTRSRDPNDSPARRLAVALADWCAQSMT